MMYTTHRFHTGYSRQLKIALLLLNQLGIRWHILFVSKILTSNDVGKLCRTKQKTKILEGFLNAARNAMAVQSFSNMPFVRYVGVKTNNVSKSLLPRKVGLVYYTPFRFWSSAINHAKTSITVITSMDVERIFSRVVQLWIFPEVAKRIFPRRAKKW